MKESYCIKDKRVTPCTEPNQAVTKKISEGALNSSVIVQFAELKKLDM